MPERERRPEPDRERRHRPGPGPDDEQFDPLNDVDDIIDKERDIIEKEDEDRQ